MHFSLREAMFILLLIMLPVAAYFFVFQPRNEQIAGARAEILKKQAKLRHLEAATKDIEDLGIEIERLEETIDLFEHKLPAAREVEVVLREVWQLATKNSLQPKGVRTDKPLSTAQYAELPLRMSISGDFDGFYKFLLELEKLPRITRMPNMVLKKAPDAQGEVNADVVLSIFYESPSAISS